MNITDFLPQCAFFTERDSLHILTEVKKSFSLPADEKWIHWPDFYHLPFEFLTYQNHYIIRKTDLHLSHSNPSWQPKFSEPSKTNFEKTFEHLQGLFLENTIQKAVPIVWSEADQRPNLQDAEWLFHQLMQLPDHFHCYGILTKDLSILGASPEYLLQIHQDFANYQNLKCLAVAGTRLSSNLDEKEFLNSTKDREEHQFVIDDIRQKLKKIGAISQSETKIQNFGSLSHLVTEFDVALGIAPLDLKQVYFLIKSLHPTAALGLYSKTLFWKEAKDFPGQTGRPSKFGAPITFSTKQTIKSVVAIRNLIWDEHKTYLCAGCGVTAQSQLDKEWIELYNKLGSVLKLFGI